MSTAKTKAAEAAAAHLTTEHARDMLRKRFSPPEWALMEEVAPATGGGTRYADAVAFNLWQSRGHAMLGFEIKVSRGDWLRELKHPEKAEDIYRYCDHWWVIAPRGVVKDGELPTNWGLFELRNSGLVQIKAAPKLDPQPITRPFFASLLRRGHEQINAIAEQMQRAAVAEARAEIDRRVNEQVEKRAQHHQKLQAQIAEFTNATGLRFDSYMGPPIETIQLAQRLEALRTHSGGALSRLIMLASDLDRAAATVRGAIAQSGLHEETREVA